MADYLKAKAATEVVQRRWTVPVDADDGPSSVALVATSITVDTNSFEGNDLVLTLSAGTAATTGDIVATVTTSRGRTLVETLYIPVVASAAQIAATARDYCYFALRKIFGTGEDPQARYLDDALERLNALIARWRIGGADIGAPMPIVAGDVVYCPDWMVSALRYNLLIELYTLYQNQPDPMELELAMRGRQLVLHENLPVERSGASFY